MKQDKHRFLRKRPGRKPGKAGSSLALVMMIGAALVIWVMCIMPLMTTTGTTAIQTEEKYDDYLESRSSIEYCKSELEKIVSIDKKVPRTFAVVRNDSTDTYSAVYKLDDSNFSNPPYSAIIQTDYVSPDTDDKPLSGDAGKNVTAICAVEWVNAENHYKITIQTYHNGEKGQTYSLIYTLSGSLLIYPESYDSGDALPLSDFVVVDGKMGANQIWNSTITMGTATSGGFSETLRAMKKDPEEEYASSLEYPAVFKKTAQAAPAGDADFLDPIKEDPVNTEQWREPTPVKANKTPKETGDIWVTVDNNNTIKVHVQTTTDTLVDNCEIYINGEKKDTVPGTGTYCVTVDYYGTDADSSNGIANEYNYGEGAVNILPATGLRMLDTVGDTGFSEYTLANNETSSITNLSKDNRKGTYSVTLSAVNNVLYGYYPYDDPMDVTWSTSNTISGLSGDKTYFFFICRPAGIDNQGNYHTDSEPKYVGMILPMEPSDSPVSGGNCLVLGTYADWWGDESYYAMNSSSNSGNLGADSLTVKDGYLILNGTSSLTWKAEQNDAGWTFCNGDNYLTMSGSYKWRRWNLSLGTSKSSEAATYYSVESAQVSTGIIDGDKKTTGYLQFSPHHAWKPYFNASTSQSTVSFLNVPAYQEVAMPTPTNYSLNNRIMEYTQNPIQFARGNIQPSIFIDNLYANGAKVTGSLNAGAYYLTADITVDGIQYCVQLGDLTVNQADMPTTLGIECSISGTDEKKVSITGTGWDADNGGTRWYGYREVAAEGENPFHWFPAEEDAESFALRLEYGAYEFAVRDCGSSNYNSIQSGSFPVTIKMNEVTLEENQNIQFLIDSDLVTWYKLPVAKLKENPEQTIQILPSRVHLIYGIGEEGGTNITWSENNDEKVNFYGVIVDGSNYCKDPDGTLRVLGPIPEPVKITHEGGRTSSMMRGRSLYFMGEGNSINTLGNDVFLTTDLLVLKNDITGGGRVIVDPYSTSEILFMSVNGTSTFTAKTVYKLKSGIDLCNPDGQYEAIGSITDSGVRRSLFREYPDYPDFNLDIAYANDAQLAHVVSGETIGWTSGGKLRGSSSEPNGGYVVCAYITDMDNSAVSYKANRVLIAAKAADRSNTLNVPANLAFTTRYLSINAEQVVQTDGNVSFRIFNLGEDESFFNWLSNVLRIDVYYSKTLQVDYERPTKIRTVNNGEKNVEQQICRYDDGTDLFDTGIAPQPLMVTYTADELNPLLNEYTSLKTVDRYVSITSGNGINSINLTRSAFNHLNLYANYVYFDVDRINLYDGYTDKSDIIIRSQESGYTEDEYLGFFKTSSSESYAGTLLYFPEQVTIQYYQLQYVLWGNLVPKDAKYIKQGFYYLETDESEKTISQLAGKEPLTLDQVRALTVFVNGDGSFSNGAYIDTGIFDNTSSSLGGFSGGNVG